MVALAAAAKTVVIIAALDRGRYFPLLLFILVTYG